MTKYIYLTVAIIILILSVALKFTYMSLQSTKEELATVKVSYQACMDQTKELNKQISHYNKMDKEANELIYQLRKEIENEKNHEAKEGCDCYNTLIPDNVIQLLHNIDTTTTNKAKNSNP